MIVAFLSRVDRKMTVRMTQIGQAGSPAIRRALCGLAVLAVGLAGCATKGPWFRWPGYVEYAQVKVESTTASQFYMIRGDLWRRLGQNGGEGAQRAGVLASAAFGPFQVGEAQAFRANAQYRLIPICEQKPAWDRAALPTIPYRSAMDSVSLSCP